MIFGGCDEAIPTYWIGEVIPSPKTGTKWMLVCGGWVWKSIDVVIGVDALVLNRL